MTNDEMKANRFLRWHNSRRKVAFIQKHLAAGHTVCLTTHTKQVRYTAKHAEMFRATKTGAFVQRGKAWDCIDGCKITAH